MGCLLSQTVRVLTDHERWPRLVLGLVADDEQKY